MSLLKKRQPDQLDQIYLRLGIEQIKDDIVIMDDGTIAALLSIKPINFEGLPEQRRLESAAHFNRWLDTLNYPIQIVGRTVNKDLLKEVDILLSKLENHIKKL